MERAIPVTPTAYPELAHNSQVVEDLSLLPAEPLVTIRCITFNHARYIREALEGFHAIRRQGHRHGVGLLTLAAGKGLDVGGRFHQPFRQTEARGVGRLIPWGAHDDHIRPALDPDGQGLFVS